MAIKLDSVQRRVLGVLIEKSMTTPGSYPMTLNAIVTGCNQSTCREPVMQLTDSEVSKAAYQLQRQELMSQADPDRTARVCRFKHEVGRRFQWDLSVQAIMAELLLRGPQTVGELKGNASRMKRITELSYVIDTINELTRHDPSWVRELSRQPGRSAVRYDHLLYPDDEVAEPAPASIQGPRPEPAAPSSAPSDLAARLERLKTELGELSNRVNALEDRSSA